MLVFNYRSDRVTCTTLSHCILVNNLWKSRWNGMKRNSPKRETENQFFWNGKSLALLKNRVYKISWKSLENWLTVYQKANFHFEPSSTVVQTIVVTILNFCELVMAYLSRLSVLNEIFRVVYRGLLAVKLPRIAWFSAISPSILNRFSSNFAKAIFYSNPNRLKI